MAKFSYKKYAKEVVEKLFEIDDIEIYDKFIKEFERLIKQDQYKKDEPKRCSACYSFYAGRCIAKDEYTKADGICNDYESARMVAKKMNRHESTETYDGG